MLDIYKPDSETLSAVRWRDKREWEQAYRAWMILTLRKNPKRDPVELRLIWQEEFPWPGDTPCAE